MMCEVGWNDAVSTLNLFLSCVHISDNQNKFLAVLQLRVCHTINFDFQLLKILKKFFFLLVFQSMWNLFNIMRIIACL